MMCAQYVLSSGKDSIVRLWELSTCRSLITYTGAGVTGKQEHRTQAIFNHTEDYGTTWPLWIPYICTMPWTVWHCWLNAGLNLMLRFNPDWKNSDSGCKFPPKVQLWSLTRNLNHFNLPPCNPTLASEMSQIIPWQGIRPIENCENYSQSSL